MSNMKQMSGEEFVRKVLGGERDLSGIELEAGFGLSNYEGYNELQDYLRGQNFEANPLVLTGSKLYGLQARGIHLPYLRAEMADFSEGDLSGADFWMANLGRADFWMANLGGGNLCGANLRRANLREVENLGSARGLDYANYNHTRVGIKEKRIIEEALRQRELFSVEE